jgi:hypothetical protein
MQVQSRPYIPDKRMSEYQYYEFQTADRRLSEKEMQELRSYSTRAVITPTSFSNEYSFGSFKGSSIWQIGEPMNFNLPCQLTCFQPKPRCSIVPARPPRCARNPAN